jgi:hypothetical protein
MRIVSGAICRTKTGLNMRATPGGVIVATLAANALVEMLGAPVDGWARAVARGWTLDGKTIYSDPDMSSSVKATTRASWRFVEVQGAVAVKYLDVVDGPA